MNFVIRLLVNAAALWVATQIHIGVTLTGGDQLVTLLVVALIFGVVNAVIKPILAVLTCPLYLLTLGLFTFIVNALMLLLTSALANALHLGFHVQDFIAALLGAIVISLVSFVLSVVLREL